jgi:hypothetical protein
MKKKLSTADRDRLRTITRLFGGVEVERLDRQAAERRRVRWLETAARQAATRESPAT